MLKFVKRVKMKTYRFNMLIAGLVTVLAFVLVLQVSCKKPEDTTAPVDTACLNIDCNDQGECVSGQCVCYAGWEGYACDIKAVKRYVGAWSASETVVASTIQSNIGQDSAYNFYISYDGESVTTFKLSGLMNKQNDTIIVSLGEPLTNYYAPLAFRFRNYASTSVADLYIPGCGGYISESGSYMDSMSYKRWYGMPGNDTVVVKETINIAAQKMQ